jgi:hypothetical protein
METEKLGGLENDSHVAFGQKFPAEKGNCCCRDAIENSFVAEFRAKYSHIFMHDVVPLSDPMRNRIRSDT